MILVYGRFTPDPSWYIVQSLMITTVDAPAGVASADRVNHHGADETTRRQYQVIRGFGDKLTSS